MSIGTSGQQESIHARTRRADRHRRTRRRRGILAALTSLAVVGGLAIAVPAMSAPTYEFVIDSLPAKEVADASDKTPGDGVCATAAGTCTLRAALQESNALNLSDVSRPHITVKPGVSGSINPPTTSSPTNWMRTSPVTSWDNGAYYEITAPVSIDLDNRVSIWPTAEPTEAAALHVNAKNVELRNVSKILASGTSIVMGPSADNVLVEGGKTVTSENYFPERFITYREGAKNITVRNYAVNGFYNESLTTSAIFQFNPQAATPISNLVFEGVTVDNSTNTGACSGSDGSGCGTNLFTSSNDGNTVLDGFTMTGSLVNNHAIKQPDARAFAFGAFASISNFSLTGNAFTNIRSGVAGKSYAFVNLGTKPLGGTNVIQANTFAKYSASGMNYAINWKGSGLGTTDASSLRIQRNSFDGFGGNSISLETSGRTEVSGNTFGAATGSQNAPGTAEETAHGSSNVMFNNGTGSNQQLNTWYPDKPASVVPGTPDPAAVAVNPSFTNVCLAEMSVVRPTGSGTNPAGPVTLDVYWTGKQTAELYLGSVTGISGDSAKLIVGLPLLSESALNAVKPDGDAQGYLRVQTHAETSPQKTSSQYSRFVAVSGNCRPQLTLDQAIGQNDPTMARDLHFTLRSTLALDPATVTADDIHLTAVPTAKTIDAGRINARIVGVTPVPGTDDREFDVVVRTDDSATVTVALAAEKVAAPNGLTNAGPATSTDAAITFENPVRVTPTRLAVVAGDTRGASFGIKVAAGAPTPLADLAFTLVPDAIATQHGLVFDPNPPVISAGTMGPATITVTAPKQEVAANTKTVLSLTLASSDPAYDGLVVPQVTPYLFETDPSIRIKKSAYIDATDTSSVAGIIATGKSVTSGSRVVDGMGVCFVYTVTNVSKDDWATTLTGITVTDSDTRLGPLGDGVIGTIPSLGIGQSAQLYGCTSIIVSDTTLTGGARAGTD